MPNAKRKKQLFLFLFLGIACVFILIDVVRTVSAPTIYGTVVDESGAPLDGVTVGVTYWEPYPKLFLLLRGGWPDSPDPDGKSILRHMTVDGEFRVRDKDLFRRGEAESIYFAKEGYYSEKYDINQKYEVTADGKKVLKWSGMRVVMRKKPPPPKKVRTLKRVTTGVWYDMAERKKRILEFSTNRFSGKAEVVPRDVPFGQEPQATRYFELDFLRDERGEIVLREFPGVVDDWGDPIQYPAVFIVRLHSNDPDDGILLVGEGESVPEKNPFDGTIRSFGNGREFDEERTLFRKGLTDAPTRFLKERTMAPEDGYTRREISIPIEEVIRIWAANGLKACSLLVYRTVFIRAAGHYAKAYLYYANGYSDIQLGPVDSEAFREKSHWEFQFDMYLNPKEGDRHLSEYETESGGQVLHCGSVRLRSDTGKGKSCFKTKNGARGEI